MKTQQISAGRSLETWARIASALEIRIAAIEAEQRGTADEYDWLHARGNEIFDEFAEREQLLRILRERHLAISAMLRRAAA